MTGVMLHRMRSSPDVPQIWCTNEERLMVHKSPPEEAGNADRKSVARISNLMPLYCLQRTGFMGRGKTLKHETGSGNHLLREL